MKILIYSWLETENLEEHIFEHMWYRFWFDKKLNSEIFEGHNEIDEISAGIGDISDDIGDIFGWLVLQHAGRSW